MSCSRCNGCMVDDFLLDMEDSSGPMWLQAKRCMNCGNVAESMLQRNRETQGARLHTPASSAPVGNDATVPMGVEATSNLAA
ncbi:MAG: hypothetical protein R3B37_07595 [Nitrospira sp.]|nr:hypothetical protein [Nitrospira sp.]